MILSERKIQFSSCNESLILAVENLKKEVINIIGENHQLDVAKQDMNNLKIISGKENNRCYKVDNSKICDYKKFYKFFFL